MSGDKPYCKKDFQHCSLWNFSQIIKKTFIPFVHLHISITKTVFLSFSCSSRLPYSWMLQFLDSKPSPQLHVVNWEEDGKERRRKPTRNFSKIKFWNSKWTFLIIWILPLSLIKYIISCNRYLFKRRKSNFTALSDWHCRNFEIFCPRSHPWSHSWSCS